QVDHVARPVGDDTARGAVVRARGVDELAPGESEASQVAGDGPPVEQGAAGGEFRGDARSGPLVLALLGLDRGDRLLRGGLLASVRCRRALVQAGRAVAAIAVNPFGGTRARDAHLGCYMGDRAPLAAMDKAVSALDGQWRITVGHESRSFQRLDELVALLIIAAGACSPHVTPAPVSATSHPATPSAAQRVLQ